MNIKLSRHAKRRAKLYQLSEATIHKIIQETPLVDGQNEIVRYIPELPYPLKIIVCREGELATVITNYPLKRGVKDESLL